MRPHGGIFLGKVGRRMLIDRSGEHVLAIGPTRSGKGVSVILTTLLDGWFGSAIIHDPKGELWTKTAARRARYGHCLKFDPTDMDSVRINLFDLVDPDTVIADVQNFVSILTEDMLVTHWSLAAKELMVGAWLHLLYHAPPSEKNFGGLRRFIQRGDRGLAEIIKAAAHPVAVRIAESILGHGSEKGWTEDEKSAYRDGVFRGAGVLLQLFDDPVMDHLTSATEISISQLVCGGRPVNLYLSIPDSDAARVRPYVKALMISIRRTLMKYEDADRHGNPKNFRLLFCWDEYLDFKVRDLAEALTKMASYHMTALLVAQAFELIERSDDDNGAGILNNCSTHVMFRPNSDTEAERISRMVGTFEFVEDQESTSRAPLSFSWRNKTTSPRRVQRPILPAFEIRRWPKLRWCIVMGHGKPIRARVALAFGERRFRRLVKPPPPLRNPDGTLFDSPGEVHSPWANMVGEPVDVEWPPRKGKAAAGGKVAITRPAVKRLGHTGSVAVADRGIIE